MFSLSSPNYLNVTKINQNSWGKQNTKHIDTITEFTKVYLKVLDKHSIRFHFVLLLTSASHYGPFPDLMKNFKPLSHFCHLNPQLERQRVWKWPKEPGRDSSVRPSGVGAVLDSLGTRGFRRHSLSEHITTSVELTGLRVLIRRSSLCLE